MVANFSSSLFCTCVVGGTVKPAAFWTFTLPNISVVGTTVGPVKNLLSSETVAVTVSVSNTAAVEIPASGSSLV